MRNLLRRAHEEEGSTLLLTIAYGMVMLALIFVVVAATSLLVERKRLMSLADGAALAASESFTLVQVVPGGSGVTSQPSDQAATTVAAAWISTAPTGLSNVQLVDAAVAPDGSVSVTLSARWYPPVASLAVPEGLRIEVTVTARSVFGVP